MSETRTDTTSRLIRATAPKIWNALTRQSALRQWKAPAGMHLEIFHYNARVDGTYRVALRYDNPSTKGKSGENADVVNGRFLEMEPNKKIVEAVRFESDDPSFAGEMIMTTELTPEKGGTRITFTAENVPTGITYDDHIKGMEDSLEQLSALVTGI
jgi:uncharacterized protein YndB with AHSA1/START domain